MMGNAPLPAAAPLSAAARRRSLAAVMMASMTVGMTLSMTAPLIAFALAAKGVSPSMIGLNAAMPAIATLAVGAWLPRVMGYLGAVRAMVAGSSITVIILLLFPLLDSITAWFLLRFLLGPMLTLFWVTSETWVNRVSEEARRGQAVSLYATLWGAGVALGPQILHLTGFAGTLPFLACAALMALALVPVLLAHHLAPPALSPEHATSVPAVWALVQTARSAPLVLGAAFVCGFAETCTFSLLPLYAASLNLDPEHTVMLMSVFAAGGLALQPPLGWLADRWHRVRLLALCATIGIVGVAVMPLLIGQSPLLWPVLFLWGGAVAGFYTLGLTLLGQHFPAAALARANVAFIMAYTLGMVIGPVSGGAAQDLWPPHGLMLAYGLIFAGYLLLLLRTPRPATVSMTSP